MVIFYRGPHIMYKRTYKTRTNISKVANTKKLKESHSGYINWSVMLHVQNTIATCLHLAFMNRLHLVV